jgi:hypothetical protein
MRKLSFLSLPILMLILSGCVIPLMSRVEPGEPPWQRFRADSGYEIEYPIQRYSLRSGITNSPAAVYPGVKVIEPNDLFYYQEPRAVTYRLSIAVTANEGGWTLEDAEELLADSQIYAYDPAQLADRTIEQTTLAGEPALQVEDLPVGPQGITQQIVALHNGFIYELLVEPHEITGNLAVPYIEPAPSSENRALMNEIIASFRFWEETPATITATVSTTPVTTPTVAATATATPIQATATPTTTEQPLATIESVEVQILESLPVQVNVIARGYLNDACTRLGEIRQRRTGNEFQVELRTARAPDDLCAQVISPFEQTLPLEVAGLPAGQYTVVVNGVSAEFELPGDNAPVTVTPPPGDALISGQIWHDLCAVSGGEGGEAAQPGPGCVAAEGGGFRANGAYEAGEPPIASVQVTLASPSCSAVITTTTTSNVGGYAFAGLAAGDYCVLIDPLQEPNTGILLPGGWTFPSGGEGATTRVVTVAAGQQQREVNFGWDYQFLPETGETACTNQATFITDVTVPDNTRVAPGATFLKTWRVRNDGTCTWGPSRQVHSIVFSNGEPMGATDAAPLPGDVAPGATVDVSISMTAPTTPGTYRSEWMLAVGSEGGMLGVGAAGRPLWAQIIVDPNAAPSDDSAPATATPIPTQEEEPTTEPTATAISASATPTATVVEELPTPTPEPAADQPSAVLAQVDAPIYGGSPGDTSNQIGVLPGGYLAPVTGASSDGAWWRIICPDGSVGDCWVSADPSVTQPDSVP